MDYYFSRFGLGYIINRSTVLGEILELDKKIRVIRSNRTFLNLSNNLEFLEKKKFGSRLVTIAMPDNDKIIKKVRSNSPELRAIMTRYRERHSKYEDKLISLVQRKNQLHKQLYK